MKRTCRNDFED